MKKEIKDADHRGGILTKEFDAINFKIHQIQHSFVSYMHIYK